MADRALDPGRPDVSVLIVNFRSTSLLRDCLHALRRSTGSPSLEIIVVDNASPDFDADLMSSEFPEVVFLPQGRNTTFTGGSNIAFARSTGRFILLLNPDTRVEPEAMARAIAHLDEDARIAGLTAYLLEVSGGLQRYYRRLPRVRDVPVVLMARIFGWIPGGRRYLMSDASFESSMPVEQPPGAFILLRRSACPEPILDPGYFNLFSDVELCRTVQARGGFRLEPDVRCIHVRGGAGVGTTDPNERSLLHQDYVWGVRRYFRAERGVASRAWIEIWVVAFWALRVAQAVTRDQRHLRSTLRACRRSLAGHPPEYPSPAS